MHFEFIPEDNHAIEVWFKSSKEEVLLGMLQFTDIDGDMRDDISRLLLTVIKYADSPMLLTFLK